MQIIFLEDIDSGHLRDVNVPCEGCGARWQGVNKDVIAHLPNCGYMLGTRMLAIPTSSREVTRPVAELYRPADPIQ